jgi:two-component sensor histidine kinase
MEISIKEYLFSLIDEIIENFPNSNSVTVEKNIDDFIFDAKRLQSIGIIINELLTNIMKYAFVGKDEGVKLIAVSVKKNKNTVSIIIKDNGVGIPVNTNFENSSGFGLTLVRLLTEQVGGTIRIERENGTSVVLEFEI